MSSLNISLSLKKIPLLIEETRDLVDENIRLSELDEPVDNDEIIANLKSIAKAINFIDSELVYNLKEFLKYKAIITDYLSSYDSLLLQISDHSDVLNLSGEKFKIGKLKCFEQEEQATIKKGNSLKTKKSVRFKESLIDPPSSSSTMSPPNTAEDEATIQAKQNLFQTAQLDDNELVSSTSDFSNRELFINNQQELLQQDSMLSSLSSSVRTQHQMGLSINEELDDHMIILNDLEAMIDGTSTKLDRGRKRLSKVNEKLKGNGNWVTILILLIVLVFLLVVL